MTAPLPLARELGAPSAMDLAADLSARGDRLEALLAERDAHRREVNAIFDQCRAVARRVQNSSGDPK